MRQTSRILTGILSVGTFLLVHTVCKPCHVMMTMPCERSTTAAGLVLALVLLADILSFVVKSERFRAVTSGMNAPCSHLSVTHANYIHVTEDGTYTVKKPADPTDIHTECSNSTVTVCFTAPDAPENAKITGYKIIATDPDGKRTKTLVQDSPVILENLDAQKSYTIQIITLATSGQSAGEQTFTLEAEPAPVTAEPTEAPTETTSVPTETTMHTEPSASNDPQEQIIITDYAEL